MSTTPIEPVELRTRGFEVLVQSLGWANAVRFIQQYDRSRMNYTDERERILPDWDADEMIRRINSGQSK